MGEGTGDVRKMGEPGVVDVDRRQAQPRQRRRCGPDGMHEADGSRRADHGDPVACPQLAVVRSDRVAVGRRGPCRADPAGEVVVDSPDVDLHRPPDPAAAEHDVDDARASPAAPGAARCVRRRRRSRRCRRTDWTGRPSASAAKAIVGHGEAPRPPGRPATGLRRPGPPSRRGRRRGEERGQVPRSRARAPPRRGAGRRRASVERSGEAYDASTQAHGSRSAIADPLGSSSTGMRKRSSVPGSMIMRSSRSTYSWSPPSKL